MSTPNNLSPKNKVRDITTRKVSLFGSVTRNVLYWFPSPSCKNMNPRIALCIAHLMNHPSSHQVVRVPFRFPPRAPPGHSVRNHPPTATPSTLQRHARSPQWADSVANTVVGMQGKGSGERAYCTMLGRGAHETKIWTLPRIAPPLLVKPECRWWRTSQIRLLVPPIEERRAWKLGNELFLYI